MSTCNVAVRLDGSDQSYEPGQEVRGTVTVSADQEVESKGLKIRQIWRVHGRGNRHEEVVAEQSVELPRLGPGVRPEHRFRFAAPARPLSYHGHLIHVDHYVRAEVDVPWAVDPSAEADYLLTPGAASAEAYLRDPEKQKAPPKYSLFQRVLGWILLPVIVPMLLALLVLVLPIVLVVALVMLVRKWLAERRLGEVTAEIGAPTLENEKAGGYAGPGAGIVRRLRGLKGLTHVVHPGQEVPVRLRFTCAGNVNLSGAELKLQAVESATSGSGTNSTTHTHTVWEKTVALIEPRPLQAGQPVEVAVRVALPDTTAFSLDTPSNKVSWTATIRISIPGWPDWVRRHELRMVPGR